MNAEVRDATNRLSRRADQQRRRRTRRWLTAAGVVIAVAGLIYLFGFSTVFATQKLVISGEHVLTEKDVTAIAGISLGTPLARVDANGAADRLAAQPAVAEVTVRRVWPNTVTIALVERRPRLAIPAEGGFLLADASGVVFQTVVELPRGLVLVAAPANNQQLLVDVGTVFSSLSPDTAAKVQRVEAATRDGITLRLADGIQVMWGSAEESAVKSQVLDDLLPKGGHAFDVSAPGSPTRR